MISSNQEEIKKQKYEENNVNQNKNALDSIASNKQQPPARNKIILKSTNISVISEFGIWHSLFYFQHLTLFHAFRLLYLVCFYLDLFIVLFSNSFAVAFEVM